MAKEKKRLPVWTIALIAAGAALVLFLVFIAFLFCNKKVQEKETRRNEPAGKISLICAIYINFRVCWGIGRKDKGGNPKKMKGGRRKQKGWLTDNFAFLLSWRNLHIQNRPIWET